MEKNRMFPFITKTWNPIKFCSHDCVYCWAKKYGQDQKPTLYINRLDLPSKTTHNDFTFVCDMGDLFCPEIPNEIIELIISRCNNSPGRFLYLTKNPTRYDEFYFNPSNTILGVTIETNRSYPNISKAPLSTERFKKISSWICPPVFISIEPIMDFDLDDFLSKLKNIGKVWGIAIGYDNHHNNLPEPPLSKTKALIGELLANGFSVYEKTLREAGP